jgi:prephenate dehydrogenase
LSASERDPAAIARAAIAQFAWLLRCVCGMIAVGEMDGRASQEKVRVGLLGVGRMGSAMARRLLDRGIAVVAWDRNAEHVRDLGGRGGDLAVTPRDVVHSAGVVITMLPTAEVILDLVESLLDDWPQDTIWLQMSSVGGG